MKVNWSIMILVLGVMIVSNTVSSASIRICQTHEDCEIGKACQCRIPANAASSRYYYADIIGFKPSQVYQCTLQAKPSLLIFDKNASIFPTDSYIACADPCNSFPVSFTLTTPSTVSASEEMILAYFVPAGDVPFDFQVSCHL